jgi:hypothetical protein
MTHYKQREDAIWIGHGASRREYVPTVYGERTGNTVWIDSIEQLREAGGGMHWSEDQTEIVLTLPPGHKFSIQFERSKEE